jgi:hypothetical protein
MLATCVLTWPALAQTGAKQVAPSVETFEVSSLDTSGKSLFQALAELNGVTPFRFSVEYILPADTGVPRPLDPLYMGQWRGSDSQKSSTGCAKWTVVTLGDSMER